MPRETFKALNGLRFVAALAVVSFHYAPSTVGYLNRPAFVRNAFAAGPVALEFFYILSGFVLAHAYSHRLPRSNEEHRLFWFARVARLYPVYLFAFLLFLPMAAQKYLAASSGSVHGVRLFVSSGLLSVFALQAWTPLSQAWNGPSWSLSVEAFFYLIFPFAARRILRLPWNTLLSGLAVLWGAMLCLTLAHLWQWLPKSVWQGWIQNNPLFWTPTFLLGIVAYRLHRVWPDVRATTSAWAGALSLGLLLLLCGMLSPSSRELLISGGAAPLMMLIVLAYSHQTSLASRVAGTRLLFELGALSYITYIIQAPLWHIYRLAEHVLRHTAQKQPPSAGSFLLFLAVLLCASVAVQRLVERPAQRWLLARVASPKQRRMLTPLVDSHIEAA